MCSVAIVQRGLRTPTGPFFARFFIGIILGLVAEFASTRLMMSSFAARWMGRKQNVGWKFQHGCSTGRHALTLSLILKCLHEGTQMFYEVLWMNVAA
jgi:hypothetical protein